MKLTIEQIIILALFIEAICETLKMTWQNGKLSKDRVIALIVALVVCIATGADILAAVGIIFFIPFLGAILTAILVSRGAAFIHDLMATVGNFYQGAKLPPAVAAAATTTQAATNIIQNVTASPPLDIYKLEPQPATFGADPATFGSIPEPGPIVENK